MAKDISYLINHQQKRVQQALNIHPRTLIEIRGYSPKGIVSKLDPTPMIINYKTIINARTEKPIFIKGLS